MTGNLIDGHNQPVTQGQSLMTVKKNVVGRKKFDYYDELPNGDESLILFKEEGNTFDEKNQENGLRKRDPNIVDVQSPTDVTSEEAKEQFDTNTVDVQKYDAPNDNDNTEAAVDDTTEEDYTAMTQVWKSKMRRKMNTKFQYAISAVDTSLNHPLSSSFSNAQ